MGCGRSNTCDPDRLQPGRDLSNEKRATDDFFQKKTQKTMSNSLREQVSIKLGHLYQFYTLQSPLSYGTFGPTYKACQVSSTKTVSVKSIPKSSVQRPDDTNAILEINLIQSMNHPNIVKLEDVIEDTNKYFVVSELCSGGDVLSKLDELEAFNEKMVAKWAKQILSGLEAGHQKGVFHRDLKPENLLFKSAEEPEIKIADFGLSTLNCKSGQGTLKKLAGIFFRAPEEFLAGFNEKSDVWSVGVILHLILVGSLPFTGKSEQEVIESIKTQESKFDGIEWNEVSEECKDFLRHLLKKNYNERCSISEALRHPWFSSQEKIDPGEIETLKILDLRSLRKFHKEAKIKKEVVDFIVSQFIFESEIGELKQALALIGCAENEKLSNDDVTAACLMCDYNKIQIQKILFECNKGLDEIGYNEFIGHVNNKKKQLSLDKLGTAFQALRTNEESLGCIQELKGLLEPGSKTPETTWNEIFKLLNTGP